MNLHTAVLGFKKVAIFAGSLVLLANAVSASVIISLSGGPTPSGGNFEWDYSVNLSGDQNFRSATPSGDFTEIIDFGGFVSASWTPGVLSIVNAIISTQPTGPGFPPTGGTDSPAITNVVIHNGGTDILGNGSTQQLLGTLVLISTSGTQAGPLAGSFSTQAQKKSDSSTTFNQGFLPVPTQPSEGVPEPASLALIGAGLTGIAFMLRSRKA